MFTINFDFDGTLYVWDSSKSLEDVGKTNYPMEQEHIWPMLYAAERLNNDFPGLVRVFSAVLNDGVENSKKRRISRDIGADVANRSLFSVFGESKASKVDTKGRKRVSIKAYNGINGTKGTWTGYSVHATSTPEVCYKQLKAIINTIVEDNPEVDILIGDFSKELREWEAA